ncbi:MAG: GNAT family N-acetyltransferase [Saprospiraceae bacterium]|nr:GNAT family N-acetyltransferase [Saprospiraceae bacterium]
MKIQEIPPTKLRELQEISQIAYSTNFGHHWEGNGLALYLEDQFNAERLQREFQDPEIGYYFVLVEDEVVGFAKMKWQSLLPEHSEDSCCELEKIYMLPSEKGKGLGRYTMEKLIQQAKMKDKAIFFLCVIDTNTAAMAFYEKLGFEFHSKTTLEAPLFKEDLKGMHRMYRRLA